VGRTWHHALHLRRRLEPQGRGPDAGGEFLVSIVGPLTSFLLAALCWGLLHLVGSRDSPVGAALEYLAVINTLLGAFNLLPGFPLDGGRVLRSAIWAATGNLKRATEIASYVGQGFGFLLIFFGLSQVLGGNLLGGLWISFIGWFLNGAAESVRHEQVLREGLGAIRVGDLMNRDLPLANPDMSVQELVLDHMLRRGRRAVLVVDDGHLLGIVTVSDARELPQSAWATTAVSDIMTRAPLRTVSPDVGLDQALQLLVDGTLNQLPVVEGPRPVGLLSRADVLRFLQLRVALGVHGPRRAVDDTRIGRIEENDGTPLASTRSQL
jgi:CBS domain-containing protein